ncbi:metallophosphoesterase family protein [Caballeronia sp. J97]|uniref:metallophosphoesterase family protein n=1 Tax=Caballeronia sp. J97 TaxID=2805429 RepID=UPI002AB243C5|nr:metallophosphoesterase [Caballeronia sp. J97]
MILEILQRQYMAQACDYFSRQLGSFCETARRDAQLRAQLEHESVSLQDLLNLDAQVQNTAASVAAHSNADACYLPRDGAASLMQSLFQRYCITHRLVDQSGVQNASEADHPISDVSLGENGLGTAGEGLFERMGQTDIRWLACVGAKVFSSFGGKRPFPPDAAPPRTIAANARVFLVGDWGSGVSRARKIASRIATMLESEPQRDQHVIHLGDVYYSGWPEEYDDHFLQFWPVRPGNEGRVGSWSLNANHDMFSQGAGYFGHLLKDARFSGHRGSSYFSLESDHWQLLGLDSAFEDGTLAGEQFEWVEHRQKTLPNKKLILLTHHQPFSAFESEYTALQRLYERNEVTAWFWGHEHRFAVYDPRPRLPFGRLVGHGGVPVYARPAAASTPDGVRHVGNGFFRSGLDRFALFGFAVLNFDGPRIGVEYIDEHGNIEFSETLS